MPIRFPCRKARRMRRRRTYPRPSLAGLTPSPTRNVTARTWSAMTRTETSPASPAGYSRRADSADRLDERHEKVGVVVAPLALEDGGHPFEAHPGVDGRRRERGEAPLAVLVLFHEDEVPELDEPVAPLFDEGARVARLDDFAEVPVELRARAARARSHPWTSNCPFSRNGRCGPEGCRCPRTRSRKASSSSS